jgi:hypothetical protein
LAEVTYSVEEALAVISRCNPSNGKTKGEVFTELTGLRADEPGIEMMVMAAMDTNALNVGGKLGDAIHTAIMDGILLGAALARRQ